MGKDEKYDPGIWERKDKLMARLSALKATTVNHEGKGVKAEDILVESETYYNWLIKDQEYVGSDSNNGNSTVGVLPTITVNPTLSIPVPTLKQKEWLDKIQHQHGFTMEAIFTKFNTYPSTKDEAVKMVRELKTTSNEKGK